MDAGLSCGSEASTGPEEDSEKSKAGHSRSTAPSAVPASGLYSKLAALGRPLTQRITIAYRDCAFGSGAFWDHYTIQAVTKRKTVISHNEKVDPRIQGGRPNDKQGFKGQLKTTPATTTDEGKGLLVITGGRYGLDSESPNPRHVPSDGAVPRHRNRVDHELALLRQAQLTGRPVLGICGGSWRVLESHGGTTRQLKNGTHQGPMPFIDRDGKVGGNVAAHDIEIGPGSMLHSISAWQKVPKVRADGTEYLGWEKSEDAQQFRVNTVHWAAAHEDEHGLVRGPAAPREDARETDAKLKTLQVSARETRAHSSYVDDTGAGSGQGNAPIPLSVEAFETRSGAPAIGVQWHPEAYAPVPEGSDGPGPNADESGKPHPGRNLSLDILNYMAKAGDAYEAHRAMTRAFEAQIETRTGGAPSDEIDSRQAAGWLGADKPPKSTSGGNA
ncbi:gamma-glutamyl-gamma-aminobutyrate hydrolase family protein [Burkholderia sp. WAC0059]|uniref:gamma-glutamyl-gamma-aminobutyrate hydrolase family protein n=1 Tax=Burkholderia sp. WAC0059 TaxID=2066022 RepID=UPI0015E08EB7|nr:gamma-glutamyl-gamma-aminobutyrate hydrolase family protein [Burkholderia sp. WAC0059]